MAQQLKIFRDVSTRASIFRNRLFDDFHVFDGGDGATADAPIYSTKDILTEPELFRSMLRESPNQLVKFKIFKRTTEGGRKQQIDKRLMRIKYLNKLPVGVWASWVVYNPLFQNLIMALIFLTAILTAVRVDLNPEEHYAAIQVLGILDDVSVLLFALEIVLKWMDSFEKFWTDNWNIFDFLVTLLSSIPENIVGPAAARYLRIFRAIRPLKMIVRFHNLRVIVKTIFDAFQSMAFIMLLLCMIIYLYSVFALNLFYDYSQSEDKSLKFQHDFGSIGDAIITLFHLLTLDQWFYIHNDVKRVSSPVLTTFFFISWVFIGAFVFRNIFIGVMVKHFEMVSSAVMKDEQLAIDKETVNKAVKAQKEQDSSQDSSGLKANAKSQINLMKQKMAKKAGRNRKSAGEENETFQLLRSIESLLSTSKSGAESLTWDSNMSRTLNALAAKQIETTWPRDTLFRYLQCMQNLQENIKEHQELQLLAGLVAADHLNHDFVIFAVFFFFFFLFSSLPFIFRLVDLFPHERVASVESSVICDIWHSSYLLFVFPLCTASSHISISLWATFADVQALKYYKREGAYYRRTPSMNFTIHNGPEQRITIIFNSALQTFSSKSNG